MMILGLNNAFLILLALALLGRLSLLGQENGIDIGQDSTLSDGYAGQEPVQLFVVADGELQVPSCQRSRHINTEVYWGSGPILAVLQYKANP
jgi:hypothetical protein